MVKKILIIDDDQSFAETIRDRLDFEGYDVSVAADGDQGLDLAEKERPDLIVLDIMMPRLNGYAFLKMLRSRPSGAKAAVVVCTGVGSMMDDLKGEGISGFLVKPFDPQELVNLISVSFKIEDETRAQKRTERFGSKLKATGGKTGYAGKQWSPRAPLTRPAPDEDTLAPAHREDTQDAETSESEGRPKILVIDDEEDFAEELKNRLVHEGYDVIVAHNGQDGLKVAGRRKPNLILMDVMMPRIDGYMACRLLKFDERYKHIPVIMLTARSIDADRDLGLTSGADEYLVKPVDFDVLLDMVKKHLTGNKRK